MNVLRVVASMDPSSGGPCQGIRNSIPELEKLGIRNVVLCLDNPDAAFLGKDAFTIHALGHSRGPWRYSKRLFPWLLNNMGCFDVVIVHGLWLYHSYAINRAFKLYRSRLGDKAQRMKNPKIFVMPHGMLDPYFQHAPGRKWKSLRNWLYWHLIERHVVNDAHGVFFTCEQELLLARGIFPTYSPRSEKNVGYGISSPPLYTTQMRDSIEALCPRLRNNPYLLFLGRIDGKKGVDMLIRAYAAFLAKHPVNAKKRLLPKLVIAGPGLETSYGKKVKKLVSEKSELQNQVFFPGMLWGDAKWGAFYGCEAFVLPSHQENFGIAIVEALACGRPVLISNQVNIWREIKLEDAGIVAEDTQRGTEESLDKWFLLPDTGKRQMGQNAQRTYEKYFTVRSATEQLLNAISD